MENNKKRKSRYDELFSKEDKAAAFDQLAEQFYNKNFGRMSKADIETLMFHFYIERILAKDEYDFAAYSDYKIAEELGITQTKVSSLKVRKQLQYPHAFNWQTALAKVNGNARYVDGKILLQIPDVNLYNEIRNVVEEGGGYIDGTLTRNLLKISPEYFIDLLVKMAEAENSRADIRENLKDELQKHCADQEYMDAERISARSIVDMLRDNGTDLWKYAFDFIALKLAPDSPVKKLARNIRKQLLGDG